MSNRLTKQRLGALVAIIILALSAGVHAQTSNRCFWPGSLRKCQSFWITEPRLLVRLEGAPKDQLGGVPIEDRLLYAFELGYMHNHSYTRSYGLGLELSHESQLGGVRVGIRPHVRFWLDLNENVTLDISPGLYFRTSKTAAPGYALSASLMVENKIGLTAQIEHVKPRYAQERTTHVYGGLSLGEKPGLAVAIIGSIAAGVAAIAGGIGFSGPLLGSS